MLSTGLSAGDIEMNKTWSLFISRRPNSVRTAINDKSTGCFESS